MNAMIPLDKPGCSLGKRIERQARAPARANPSTTDAYLSFYGNKLINSRHRISGFKTTLKAIHECWESVRPLLDEQLQDQWNCSTDDLTNYAILAEFIYRETGLRARDEQLYAAWLVRNSQWVEMATGEGKSLVAALAACLVASKGIVTHVITTNEYLVQRDAERFAGVFKRAGLRVSVVLAEQEDPIRQTGYRSDVVYVTGKQVGFDYLRDSLAGYNGRGRLQNELKSLLSVRPNEPIQRGLGFAIIDEIDSVLIDDARTPLLLAETTGEKDTQEQQAEAAVAIGLASMLDEGVHFTLSLEDNSVSLTQRGKIELKKLAKNFTGVWLFTRFRNEKVRQALMVTHVLKLDRDYIVRDNRIELIDYATGRPMPDRQLPHGMHQILEAHVGSTLTFATEARLSITFRGLFSRYRHVAGMSGTLRSLEGELHSAYNASCQVVPRHSKSCLVQHPGIVFGTSAERTHWIIEQVKDCQVSRQPILLAVRTVEECDALSTVLKAHNINHQLINATHNENEAFAISKAGKAGTLTVATNMAGRGTDILLDDSARAAGGLRVICLSLNESRRVDKQLYGRAARHGEPGSCQRVLSLDDYLIKMHMHKKVLKMCRNVLQSQPKLGRYISQVAIYSLQRRLERQFRVHREQTWLHNQNIERRLAYGIHHDDHGYDRKIRH